MAYGDFKDLARQTASDKAVNLIKYLTLLWWILTRSCFYGLQVF